MRNLFQRQWFLIALALCFTVGCFASQWVLHFLGNPGLRTMIVFTVMWALGLTLDASAIRRAFGSPKSLAIALLCNIALVPLLVLPARIWLSDDLFGGLMVAALVPCTLASASVWTRKAGGDDAVSMMTTVVTNVACVAVIPLGLWLCDHFGLIDFTGDSGAESGSSVDLMSQVKKLAMIVLLPLFIAQVMRRVGIADWADRRKKGFSLLGQSGILFMVLIGAAQSFDVASNADIATHRLNTQQWNVFSDVAATVVTASAVHLIALWTAIFLARAAQVDRDQQIACGIAGSQKTLMVGLQIAIDCSVSVLPMLIYHAVQLLIDTVVVQRWPLRDEKADSFRQDNVDST